MENKKHFSLAAFIGKMILKVAFIVLIFAAAQKIISKVFHKTLCVSVELKDEGALEKSPDEESAEDDVEEDADGDETPDEDEEPEEKTEE